jgi:hypothetical protein
MSRAAHDSDTGAALAAEPGRTLGESERFAAPLDLRAPGAPGGSAVSATARAAKQWTPPRSSMPP